MHSVECKVSSLSVAVFEGFVSSKSSSLHAGSNSEPLLKLERLLVEIIQDNKGHVRATAPSKKTYLS